MQQPRSSDFGLLVAGKNAQVPLREVSVDARISGYLVGIDSVLSYSNQEEEPLEVTFKFPVEASFAVVGLEAVLGGRKIKASIREKEEARQLYSDAIASGFSAAFAEEAKSGDIFCVSLGNFPPKTEAEIHLKMVGELPIDSEGKIRFSLPAVLKPRYTPHTAAATGFANSFAPANPLQLQKSSAPTAFAFSLTVDQTSDSQFTTTNGPAGTQQHKITVTSPTHSPTHSNQARCVHVTLDSSDGGKPVLLDKDLLILVESDDPHCPTATVENGVVEESSTEEPNSFSTDATAVMPCPVVMLNFFPKFSSARTACEFVFVVDRSGSMGGGGFGFGFGSSHSGPGTAGHGGSIADARKALLLFLKSLPAGCYFNIVGFGSRYASLFPKSVPYNQENLETATAHARSIAADMGGTELLLPLRYVFFQELLPSLPRQVFVITDGAVSNTAQCIEEVEKNSAVAR